MSIHGYGYCCDCTQCRMTKLKKPPAALLPRPLTTEELIRRQRQYLEEIQPFVEMKVDIIGMQPFCLIMVDGQLSEKEIQWMPGAKETCDMIDQCIAEIGRTIFK